MKGRRQLAGRVIAVLAACFVSATVIEAQKGKGPDDPQKVRRVQPAELRKMMAKDQAVLVDVRNAQAYDRGHLDGAISIPAAQIEGQAGELRRRAGSRTVVLYCSCAFEYSAADAAVKLARAGLTRVAVLAGGYFSA